MNFDEVNKRLYAFERRIAANKVADLDGEIAELGAQIKRRGPDERLIELIRLAEDVRAGRIIELAALDKKLKDLDRSAASLGEVLEACGVSPAAIEPADRPQIESAVKPKRITKR